MVWLLRSCAAISIRQANFKIDFYLPKKLSLLKPNSRNPSLFESFLEKAQLSLDRKGYSKVVVA